MGVTNPTFGTLFVPKKIEDAMLDLLKTWLPVYLAEVEKQNDIPTCSIARPRFFATSVEADLNPSEQLPAIIAVSPGTAENPEQRGESWSAWFQVTIVALVVTPEEMATRELAGYYAAAIRGAVLQHAGLNVAEVEQTWWNGEEYQGEPGDNRNRTRGAALVHFNVKVRDIVNTTAGPATYSPEIADPCSEDYPSLPLVQTVETVVHSDDPDT